MAAALFAYPLLMTYVVVASGNHFWLDALLGAFAAAAAAGVAVLLGRWRPDWAFRPERDERAIRGAAHGAEAAPA